ncbi:MAG TPA: putative Na+/H+ antiporter [Chlamydiales bacterium]|nr:putative Na+/H+ antiporter [Chlamydiales bacterium]
MIFLFAQIAKQPQRFDCLKHPVILQLESFEFVSFHVISLVLFILAIIHTLSANRVRAWARSFEASQAPKRRGKKWEKSLLVHFFYFLSEIEVIFAFWAIPLVVSMIFFYGWKMGLEYINTRDYTEPLFVAIILSLTATRPIVQIAETIIQGCAKCLGSSLAAWWFALLTVGPLLGSFITEVGAMTLCALLLSRQFYEFHPSENLAYATIALLFVNISVGGILTDFASPAVLVLAHCWHWTSIDMFLIFGWKAIWGIVLSNLIYWLFFRKEFKALNQKKRHLASAHLLHSLKEKEMPIPKWVTITHILFIVWIVIVAHYTAIFIASYLFFIGFHQATRPHQYAIRLVQPMLVGLFLAGLVIHSGLQAWWVIQLFQGLNALSVMGVAILLTGFNDNVAISYLSTLIPNWSDAMKYALFTGVIAGGGLTVIANAPNPAGYSILQKHFSGGIKFLRLFLMALGPTLLLYLIFFVFGPLGVFGNNS